MALDPYHPGWYYFPLAFNLYRNGDYERALEEAMKVNKPGYYPNHMALAAIYGQLGRTEAARVAVENLLQLFPGYGARAWEELGKWYPYARHAGTPRGGFAEGRPRDSRGMTRNPWFGQRRLWRRLSRGLMGWTVGS